MQLAAHGDVVARPVETSDDVTAAVELLDRAEDSTEVPLVDESERLRLSRLAEHGTGRVEHHHAALAWVDGHAVGYAGLVVAGEAHEHSRADVAVAPERRGCGSTLNSLLQSIDVLADTHGVHGTEVWIRQAGPSDITCAVGAGYAVHRRLMVLGRSLDPAPGASVPDDVVLRSATPDDHDAMVTVLAGAYEGTDEAGWDHDRLAERVAYPWFDHDDVLLAELDDEVLGLHWTKRRGAGVGEVYNLAVHPRAQGLGLGRVLLDAGLVHLAEVGCDEVLLWVDLSNEPAVRLYVAAGFDARWEDVALRRHADRSRHTHPHP